MIRHQPSPKPSPADRAHILVMKQEARRRRVERLIEEAMHTRNEYEDCMRGEVSRVPSVLHHHGTQWECRELARVNATRPTARICFTLPLESYEQKRCAQYADCVRPPAANGVRSDARPYTTFPMVIPGYDVAEDDYSEDSMP